MDGMDSRKPRRSNKPARAPWRPSPSSHAVPVRLAGESRLDARQPNPASFAGGRAGRGALCRQAHHRRGRGTDPPAGPRRRSDGVAGLGSPQPVPWVAGPGVPACGRERPAGPGKLAGRQSPVGTLQQFGQHPPDGARDNARPRTVREQRPAGSARARAASGHGAYDAADADVRSGSGRADRRLPRWSVSSPTRPG